MGVRIKGIRSFEQFLEKYLPKYYKEWRKEQEEKNRRRYGWVWKKRRERDGRG